MRSSVRDMYGFPHLFRPLGEESYFFCSVSVQDQIPDSGSATSISQDKILNEVYCETKLPTDSRHVEETGQALLADLFVKQTTYPVQAHGINLTVYHDITE